MGYTVDELKTGNISNQAKSNIAFVASYLKNNNFTDSAIIGILANMNTESDFDFTKYNPDDLGAPSGGICQWRDNRLEDLDNFCRTNYGSGWRSCPEGQMAFLVLEMTPGTAYYSNGAGSGENGSSLLSTAQRTSNTQTSAENYAYYFAHTWERPSSSEIPQRIEYAEAIYNSSYNFLQTSSSYPVAESQNLPDRTEPVYYSQRDSQWGDQLYSYNNHDYSQTISESACGPTCAAMIVATLVDPSITPPDACEWALTHSASTDTGVYRTWDNGTAGSFFPAYFESYGISCESVSSYNGVIAALEQGYLAVVHCNNMGAGHYIIAYGIDEDGYILVHDPYFYGDSRYYEEGKDGKLNPDKLASLMAGGFGGWVVPEHWTSIHPSSSGKFINNNGGAFPNATAASSVSQVTYKEVQVDIKASKIITADAEANTLRTKSNSLLDTPTLVESPFIILTIGNYTFGSYSVDGSFEEKNSRVRVTYPNYMSSIKINKVNGQVNQYIITMIYQIENGNDPNLLDKVFASVGYGKVYISYGDWNAPKFAYRNEEAIITRLDSNVDFANSRITYTLYCTSNALVLMGGYYNFSAGTVKPSEEIYKMIFAEESKYHLQDIFTAFKGNETFFWKCVAADDVSVEVVPKTGIDALSYINYLVTCMSPTTTPKWSAIRDANYYLTICEDRDSGTYFTIKKVASNESMISLNNTNVYEVDVGYPGDTLVTNFRINNDSSWALLYNYSQNVNMSTYVYNIDAQGQIYESYSPNITTSAKYIRTTETQKNWWTQMTQFPITAILTIKGLLRPAMLMSYVRINAMFYGLRHVSSGLYIIIKQEDVIDVNGYRTTLTLQRIAGDLDVIITDTKTVTKLVPEITYGSNNTNTINRNNTSERITKTVAENDANRVAHAEEYLEQGVSASEAARVAFVYGERVPRRSGALQAMYDAINNPETNGISAEELIAGWSLDNYDIDALNVTEFARGEWSGPDANWDHPEEQLMNNAGAAMQDIVDKISETIIGTNSGG